MVSISEPHLAVPITLSNRAAWKATQKHCAVCKTTFHCLTVGKTPSSKVGEKNSAIRQYVREASIAKDGLLVVKEVNKDITGGISREKIVVPQQLLDGLLYQLHNTVPQHPSKTQLKAQFQRMFYTIGLDSHLSTLYSNCYPCSILQKLPMSEPTHEAKAEVNHPHRYVHADIICRATQKILLLKDHFYHTAMLIPSEQAEDLKHSLVLLTEGIRHPDWITIIVDNATGFQSLVKTNDKDLTELQIKLILTDEFNKNANAVVDRGCQELEEELRKLSPEGNTLSQVTVSKAISAINRKLRYGGNISCL